MFLVFLDYFDVLILKIFFFFFKKKHYFDSFLNEKQPQQHFQTDLICPYTSINMDFQT
jgi:hypothetical protein